MPQKCQIIIFYLNTEVSQHLLVEHMMEKQEDAALRVCAPLLETRGLARTPRDLGEGFWEAVAAMT